jgi:hypothetical protein
MLSLEPKSLLTANKIIWKLWIRKFQILHRRKDWVIMLNSLLIEHFYPDLSSAHLLSHLYRTSDSFIDCTGLMSKILQHNQWDLHSIIKNKPGFLETHTKNKRMLKVNTNL